MEEEEHAAQPLAGGIAQHGYQCGMLWGSALAAGAQACRRCGTGPEAETRAILAARRLMDAFQALNRYTDCYDITDVNHHSSTLKMIKVFLIKGKTFGCFRMAARFAPVAAREIDAALSEPNVAAPAAPVSCASMLARRMGASELQAMMAAGLAGGIGLSGGACGALGAAVWIAGLNTLRSGGKVSFKSLDAYDTINRFMQGTDCEFECAKIVGRKFESVDDHAGYMREGGCARVIDALAARSPIQETHVESPSAST
jgi:hypothetical protein